MANQDFITVLENSKPDLISLAILETIQPDRCEAYDQDDEDAQYIRALHGEIEKVENRILKTVKNQKVHALLRELSDNYFSQRGCTAAASYRRGFTDAVLLLQSFLRVKEA